MGRPGICSRPNCTRATGAKGLCDPHYISTYEHGFVDAAPTVAHIKALREAGMSLYRLSELTGLSRDGLAGVGKWSDKKLVQRATQTAVLAVRVPGRPVDGGSRSVPSVGTVRRLQALAVMGWPIHAIAKECGIPSSTLGDTLYLRYRATARTASAVAEAFSRLHMTPGPSPIAARRAKAKQWHAPLLWDEDTIDDPNAQPDKGVHEVVFFPDRYRELRDDLALTDSSIAQYMGISPESLERQLYRYGLRGVA